MSAKSIAIVAIFASLVACTRTLAVESERISLRPHMSAGLRYGFLQDDTIDYTYKTSVDGKDAVTHTNMKVHIAGHAEVLESIDGLPTATYISFDRDSSMLDTLANDAQPQPYTLAGRKLLVRMNRQTGEMTTDEALQPQEATELRRFIAGEAGYYPTTDVAIGDTWTADAQTVARNIKLSLWNSTLGVKLKLIDVKVVNNRRVAEVEAELKMSSLADGYNTYYTTHAKVLVDLKTGQFTRCDAKTDYLLRSREDSKNEWGDLRRGSVEGKGESTSTSQITNVEESTRSTSWCGTTR